MFLIWLRHKLAEECNLGLVFASCCFPKERQHMRETNECLVEAEYHGRNSEAEIPRLKFGAENVMAAG